MDIYEFILEARKQNNPCVLCTLIRINGNGSSPQKPGAKMLVYEKGNIIGTIGGGVTEFETIKEAQKLLADNKISSTLLTSEGKEIFLELILPIPKLYIFGAGHVAMALAKFVKWFDFQTTIIDPRENIFKNCTLDNVIIKNSDYLETISFLPFSNNTYIVISTLSHETDREVLINVASKPHSYIGMIGSKSKIENIREYCLKNQLLTQEQLDKIDMPIGIKIVAQKPEEVAISILAKLIDEKNKKTI
jgi:xanthine dehydrogenase accessory factor